MDVYLDGERLTGAGNTLRSAIDAARAHVERGRLIIEARANGTVIPDDELQEPPPTEPYASEITFTSAEASAMVQAPLVQAAEAIGAMEGRHAEIAAQLQTGAASDALAELGHLLETWTTGKTVLQLSAELLGPEIAGDTDALDAAIGRLSVALTEVKRSMVAQDWSGLADALEFDMEPLCAEWSGILQTAATNASP